MEQHRGVAVEVTGGSLNVSGNTIRSVGSSVRVGAGVDSVLVQGNLIQAGSDPAIAVAAPEEKALVSGNLVRLLPPKGDGDADEE
jgi:hypothetical protein